MNKYPKKILSGIKIQLETEKRDVEKQIQELIEQDPFSDSDRLIDNAASDTEAKEEFNHDRYEAMLNELKQKLEGLNNALKRIQNETYGFCVKCKEMIDTERLAAFPTAQYCINCQTQKR
jgi:DnaK suppressor protein